MDLPDPDNVDLNCDGFDGEIERAVFVAPDGTDEPASGTMEAPLLTINTAIERAAADPDKDYVVLATGDYAQQVTLASHVGLYGGYDAGAGWVRDETGVSRLTAASPVIEGSNVAGVVIGAIEVDAQYVAASGWAAAVLLTDGSTEVSIWGSRLQAAVGAPGADAVMPAGSASNGRKGTAGATAKAMAYTSYLTNGDLGGSGAAIANGATCGAGGRGEGFASQLGSPTASEGAVGRGGFGDDGGSGCVEDTPWMDGANGRAGSIGNPGQAPTSAGTWTATGFAQQAAPSGDQGYDGTGGHGGGNGNVITICDPSNLATTDVLIAGTGGGGGSGGAGGIGGPGGQGGGASAAVVLWDSSLQLRDTTLNPAGGGAGGAGADGQAGGGGGSPGSGGTAQSLACPAGSAGVYPAGSSGGSGGAGGSGGSGAGGAGGPSVGVVLGGTSAADVDASVVFDLGPGGAGGASSGNAGPTGLSVETFDPEA